mgnify:CR=1 FL=1
MKAITLNSYKNLNEIEFKNIEELYKKCGYKSNKDIQIGNLCHIAKKHYMMNFKKLLI